MVRFFRRIRSAGRGAARLLPLGAGFVAALLLANPAALAGHGKNNGHEETFGLIDTLAVPAPSNNSSCASTGSASTGLASFDISFDDAGLGLYLLADRTHCSVDIWNSSTDALVAQIPSFAGIPTSCTPPHAVFDCAGPNGVLTVVKPGDVKQAWAGDDPSEVKVYDISTPSSPTFVTTINTGGAFRADEMAYDPKDNVVVVANDAENLPPGGPGPFLTFIEASSPYTVLGHLYFNGVTNPLATNGLEQTQWSPRTGLFYTSVPEVNGVLDSGFIAVIDPTTMTIINGYPTGCEPAGLAVGPEKFALVGCSDKAVEQMNLASGHIMRTFPKTGDVDEVWFNQGDSHYFTGGYDLTVSPPTRALGVIDAQTRGFDENVPDYGAADHSVAADSENNHVFVPSTANTTASSCTSGCIEVFAANKKETGRE